MIIFTPLFLENHSRTKYHLTKREGTAGELLGGAKERGTVLTCRWKRPSVIFIGDFSTA
jgi:hypothetical protein